VLGVYIINQRYNDKMKNLQEKVTVSVGTLILLNIAFAGAASPNTNPVNPATIASILCSYNASGGEATWPCYSKGDPGGTLEEASCGYCDTLNEGAGCTGPNAVNQCCYEISC